ncbi:uncharacterized protein LOC141913211 [Tubulanus polymorphus]|uniref:uncharacterized protein LOC141913211 n=1 Tax=Tubulanus polymorphus TaxID=672921 RepID=UPI003DA2BFE0
MSMSSFSSAVLLSFVLVCSIWVGLRPGLTSAQIIRCKKCKPGFGLRTYCNVTVQSVCDPCRPGATYSSTNSEIEPCWPCRRCDKGQVEIIACTPRSDRVCLSCAHRQAPKYDGYDKQCMFGDDPNGKPQPQDQPPPENQRESPPAPPSGPAYAIEGPAPAGVVMEAVTDSKTEPAAGAVSDDNSKYIYIGVAALALVLAVALIAYCCWRKKKCCKCCRGGKKHYVQAPLEEAPNTPTYVPMSPVDEPNTCTKDPIAQVTSKPRLLRPAANGHLPVNDEERPLYSGDDLKFIDDESEPSDTDEFPRQRGDSDPPKSPYLPSYPILPEGLELPKPRGKPRRDRPPSIPKSPLPDDDEQENIDRPPESSDIPGGYNNNNNNDIPKPDRNIPIKKQSSKIPDDQIVPLEDIPILYSKAPHEINDDSGVVLAPDDEPGRDYELTDSDDSDDLTTDALDEFEHSSPAHNPNRSHSPTDYNILDDGPTEPRAYFPDYINPAFGGESDDDPNDQFFAVPITLDDCVLETIPEENEELTSPWEEMIPTAPWNVAGGLPASKHVSFNLPRTRCSDSLSSESPEMERRYRHEGSDTSDTSSVTSSEDSDYGLGSPNIQQHTPTEEQPGAFIFENQLAVDHNN